MKKIAVFAFLLCLSLGMMAQDYKPLGKVEVPDYPSTEVRFQQRKSILGWITCEASYMLASRTISVQYDSPIIYELAYWAESPVKTGTAAVLSIGGKEYKMPVSFVSNLGEKESRIFFDITPAHIKHLAVSGLQSIEYFDNGKSIYKSEFNMIEQELWRRTAETLSKNIAL